MGEYYNITTFRGILATLYLSPISSPLLSSPLFPLLSSLSSPLLSFLSKI